MLGWGVGVYRLGETGPLEGIADVPALLESLTSDADREALLDALVRGERVAVWQTGLGGLDWLNALVNERRAVELPGDGYPCTYLALARDLLPAIVQGPPEANRVWKSDPGDILTAKWEGRTVVNAKAIAEGDRDEWLIVEAWDES